MRGCEGEENRGESAGEEDHSDWRIICLKQDCVKTNASSGGTDATENEKAAAVMRQLFFLAFGFSLLSMVRLQSK